MLVDVQRPIPVDQTMQKTMEVPQIQFIDKTVDVPVVVQRTGACRVIVVNHCGSGFEVF